MLARDMRGGTIGVANVNDDDNASLCQIAANGALSSIVSFFRFFVLPPWLGFAAAFVFDEGTDDGSDGDGVAIRRYLSRWHYSINNDNKQ